MGKVDQEKRPFLEPREYFWNICFDAVMSVFAVFLWYYTCFVMSEADMWEFVNRTDGNAEDKLARLFIRILMMILGGRIGYIAGTSLFCLVILLELCDTITAYVRYKRKCKLLHDGIIKSVYDIYDDGSPLSLVRLVKQLFRKRKPRNTNKGYY